MELEFHGKDEKSVALTDAQLKKYIGKKSVDFAEQIMVPADVPAGEYHFHFTVEDEKGNQPLASWKAFKYSKIFCLGEMWIRRAIPPIGTQTALINQKAGDGKPHSRFCKT